MNIDETNNIHDLPESLPEERVGIFNKQSKALVAMIDKESAHHVDSTYFITKPVEMDDTTHTFVGDFDTGKPVDINIAPVTIHESALNATAARAITDVYPVHRQLNILTSVIKQLVSHNNLTGEVVDDLDSMINFIHGRRDMNSKFKQAYTSGEDWEYVSTHEEQKIFGDMLAGGAQEIFGPRSSIEMPCGEDDD